MTSVLSRDYFDWVEKDEGGKNRQNKWAVIKTGATSIAHSTHMYIIDHVPAWISTTFPVCQKQLQISPSEPTPSSLFTQVMSHPPPWSKNLSPHSQCVRKSCRFYLKILVSIVRPCLKQATEAAIRFFLSHVFHSCLLSTVASAVAGPLNSGPVIPFLLVFLVFPDLFRIKFKSL